MDQVRYRIQATEVDQANIGALTTEIRRFLDSLPVPPRVLVLDCAEVGFIDTSAIAGLVRLQARLSATRSRLEVHNTAPAVFRALEVLGLIERFGVRSRESDPAAT
jgi:anti-anti-sigma regulatory factor